MIVQTIDVAAALVKVIALDPAVYEICGNEEHVHAGRIPPSENARMSAGTPPGAPLVLLQMTGGPGDAGYSPWTKQRIDVRSYGQTDYEAARLARAVKAVLKSMHAVTMDGGLIHHAVAEAGFSALQEPPPAEWPFVLQPWIVTYSEASGA